MRVFIRLIPVVVAMFVLLGHEDPLFADSGCPGCASNSPIINPFPIMWLRWGTGHVVKGSRTCPINDDDHASIAIDRIEPADPTQGGKVRGYQLIVLDGAKRQICKGSELTGVIFELSEGKEWVIIQQVAKTRVTADPLQIEQPEHDEYRFAYLLTDIKDQNSSLCTHHIHDAGKLRRTWRWISRYKGPQIPPSQVSRSPEDSLEIFPDRLFEYAIIIPDAEYDNQARPWDPSSTNLQPIREANYRDHGQVSLEWFEIACAGGALAHTDLNGLVEVGEPKWIRTAALRMFLAQYQNEERDTLHGIPIQYKREIPYPISLHQEGITSSNCAKPTKATDVDIGLVEAKWDDRGAVCLSHSRLSMKDTVISEMRHYPNTRLPDSEFEFLQRFTIPPCDDTSKGYFTTYVVNHIDHTLPSLVISSP